MDIKPDEGGFTEIKFAGRAPGLNRNSVSFKIFVIALLVLGLLIPASMVNSLIYERKERQQDVIGEISSKWGNAQTITGPILTIPYKNYYTNDKGQRLYHTEYAHFLPETLDIAGVLNPEFRYRGIYKAVVYNAPMEISGKFVFPSFEKLNIQEENVLWPRAFISLGLTDLRGIKEQIDARVNGEALLMDPGLETTDVIDSGVSSKVSLPEKGKEIPFDFKINLNGSRNVAFIPVGKLTNVSVKSDWKSPSFEGAFLPAERTIDDTGFRASWKVLHLNRNFPQQWTGNKYKICGSSFGINLYIPADVYQKSERMTKYALMFIVFTFTAFFFSEVMNRKRIHPIQYLLIGFAVILFYALLISISEHIPFDVSYVISAAAVIGLITAYSSGILKSRQLSMTVLGILSSLYTYLFILLQMEDYALVMGSMGLFAVLASVMYITRRINWYAVGMNDEQPEPGR